MRSSEAEHLQALVPLVEQHGNNLTPAHVLDAARPASSPLHKYFEWDDTRAAEEYRLAQARYLLRVSVQYLAQSAPEPVAVLVSMHDDEKAEENEYRVHVRDDYQELLRQAIKDYDTFKRKYATLSELRPLFHAGDQIRQHFAG